MEGGARLEGAAESKAFCLEAVYEYSSHTGEFVETRCWDALFL